MKLNWAVCVLILLSIIRTADAQQETISLEQVIALALEKNYDIRVADNLASSAETDSKYSVGALLPVINANGSRVWNTNDQKQELFNNTEVQRNGIKSNNLSGSVQLSWLLFDGTRMFATRERLAQLEAQGMLNVKNQMVNTIAEVVNNYYNIVRQKQQLNAIREQMLVSEERVRLADRKLEVGTGAKPELLQAKVDLNSQRTTVMLQEAIIVSLKEQLNGLVSMQLPRTFEVSDSIVIDLGLRREDIFENIENTNFSLLSAKKDLDIASLSLRERKGERYPFLNFTSSYNYSRTENAVAINSFTPLFNRNRGYNYGFTISMPIMNGFINRRNIQQARISIDRQQLLYEQEKTNVDVGVNNAFVNYENAKRVLLIEEENILLAKENLYITLESFKRGAYTFIELRTAQQSLAEAYNRLINARYLAKLAETELLRLNGSLLK
ncbi:MAG: TolC family protein [Cyclobacteriaceae bacterium]|jgi:outer membrane protein|nr:TolC family protein [Cyclobacteriaceae bacterium]MDH4295406.1 TolC family protein [Cyclobacteriaceae bacterium]MDH5247853.1 TolC family protein [Cyclobacteriaceae bacterium]